MHETLGAVVLDAAPQVTIGFQGQGLTEYAGAAVLVEELRRMGWDHLVKKHLPFERAQSPIAYTTGEVITAGVLSIALGARRPEHIERIRSDLLPNMLDAIPSSVTMWRHLQEYATPGEDAARAIERLAVKVATSVLDSDAEKIDLDIDATVCTVYGSQEGAEKGYNPTKKGKRSYFPMVAVCSRLGLALGHVWRRGNSGPATGDTGLLDWIWDELPPVHRRRLRVRADAGHFADALMSWCEGKRMPFVVKARKTKALMRQAYGLTYRPIDVARRKLEVAEFRYQSKDWARARRCVVYREQLPEVRDEQGKLFGEPAYDYTVIVTSLRLPPEKLWTYYNKRGEAEAIIEDLKNSIGYGVAPTSEMLANRVWGAIQLIAFNLLSRLRNHVAARETVRPKVHTLRERFLRVVAKVARHSRRVFVHIKEGWADARLFREMLTATGG